MARYRRVDPRIWDDDKFISLDDGARCLWLLLLTGHAAGIVPGLQRGGLASLAETLRRPIKTTGKHFEHLCALGMVVYDESHMIIQVPQAPKYNPPENPNQVMGWFKVWQSFPSSRLKFDHISNLRSCIVATDDNSDSQVSNLSALDKVWNDTFARINVEDELSRLETVTPIVPKKGTVKGTGTGTVKGTGTGTGTGADLMSSLETSQVQTVFDHWVVTMGFERAKLDEKRCKRILARMAEGYDVETLCQAITGASLDPWIMGTDPQCTKPGGYKGIETVLRDAGQVDRFVDLVGLQAKQTRESPDWLVQARQEAYGPKPASEPVSQQYLDVLEMARATAKKMSAPVEE